MLSNIICCLLVVLLKLPSLEWFFYSHCCLLQDLQSSKVVVVGKAIGKLYILDAECFQQSEIDYYTSYLNKNTVRLNSESCNNCFDSNIGFWHYRLGSAFEKTLKHLNFLNKNDKLSVCEVCQIAKQQRQTFPVSKTRSKPAFDLIHLDTWGPYHQTSLSGAYYFLTVVDDYTRGTWTSFGYW